LGALFLSKATDPQEQTAESSKLEDPTEIPQAPAMKKTKRYDANKGIKISEKQSVPSFDDVSIASL
jgi:hypothetical protein